VLTLFSNAIEALFPFSISGSINIALYVIAASFAFAAFTIWGLKEIPKGAAAKKAKNEDVLKSLHDGWKAVSQTKIVRGLVVGMIGAFFAAGAVIGLARTFVGDLGGGDTSMMLFKSINSGHDTANTNNRNFSMQRIGKKFNRPCCKLIYRFT